jgi:hypothetical protein
MTTKEKLVAQIMRECEKEGEPVTKEEAEEMAEMEINAKGHYEQNAAKVRKPVNRKRKVDETKKRFLNGFRIYLQGCGAIVEMPKNEVELNFKFGDDDYTVKLTRHKKRG